MLNARERYIRYHGRLFDIHAKGLGSICVREITPAMALEEAARRWGVDVEEIRDFTVKEVPA